MAARRFCKHSNFLGEFEMSKFDPTTRPQDAAEAGSNTHPRQTRIGAGDIGNQARSSRERIDSSSRGDFVGGTCEGFFIGGSASSEGESSCGFF